MYKNEDWTNFQFPDSGCHLYNLNSEIWPTYFINRDSAIFPLAKKIID